MRVSFNAFQLFQARWYEYLVRFFFGGLTTLCAGLIAKHFGPVVGGLFLGFPAIFPATATLLEKHQEEKKKRCGIVKTIRGRQAAAVDAIGAAMGSIGLVGFGVMIWKVLPIIGTPVTMLISLAVWVALSVSIWHVRKVRLALKRPPHLDHTRAGD